MTTDQKDFTDSEYYGREIFEAISYASEFPIQKKKLIANFEKLITELYPLLDKEELQEYINAKKVIQSLSEDEVEKVCFSVVDLYGDVEHFL